MFGLVAAAGSFAVKNRTAIADTVGGLFGGDDSAKRTRCANQPEDADVELMLSRARQNPADWSRLQQAWTAARGANMFPASAAELAFNAVGGEDCKVSTEGGRELASAFNLLMSKYVQSPASVTYAEESVLQRVADRARTELESLPSRIAESATEEVARSANRAAQPVVQARAQERFMDALPLVGIGVGIALLFAALRK